ncbi:NBAS subunit of NRZ tethering complex-like [Amphiura filiformis]|uniref:NBAS subunit of NRZ tethering complex-like n=1 Tax=Amphiura filiformis TaxID=82378 RepID=UPI003B2201E9
MAASTAEQDDEDSILYDLMVFASWTPEPEPLGVVIAQKPKSSLVGRLSLVALRSLWTFLRSTGIPLRSSTTCSLPTPLIKLINAQINWHMATASNGRLVAILQDTGIEIRSSRDEYETLVGKCNVPKDPYPQWCKLAWSPDCTMLAYADSSGNVKVFDLVGSLLFSIEKGKPRTPDTPVDLSRAVSALIFTDYKQTAQWSAELLVITFQGSLHSYLVSSTEGYRDNHSFLFGSQHPQGVSSAVFHPGHSLLLIGGCLQQYPVGDEDEFVTMATQQGITVWRVLSTEPYYKLVTDYAVELGPKTSRSFLRKVSSVQFFRRSKKQDGVYKMCLSPDGNKLVTLHQSGMLSVWDVPSFKRRGAWPTLEQPGHDEVNPNVIMPMGRKRVAEGQLASQSLSDVNFWSDKALILARCSGALTVSSIKNLANLLGGSCEWFEPAPRVSQASDKGFLALECESKLSSIKRQRSSSEADIDGHVAEEESDDDDDEDATLFTKTSKYMKQVLYFVTESERFQPPRKKPKMMSRVYRLVCLQKTTPEELYHRRIESEEYGEALVLAQRFGLDCDMVYQRQWRKATVSLASIQDYLSKITKRAWVLHECLERVPDDIDAARELLQYGLRGTDLEALIAIGKGEDHGRFILSSEPEHDESLDEYDEDAEELQHEREKEHRKALLEQVDFSCLNLEQRELCRCRTKLLTYLDRLNTYEEILGGGEAASRFYNDTFFKDFRSQNIVEAAVEFARDSDWKALEIMFTHHGKDLLPHWLVILNNFPETTSPTEYKILLPEAGDSPDYPEVFEWEDSVERDPDWCEEADCQAVINPTPVDFGAFLYHDDDKLREFCAETLTHKHLTSWYGWRARDIESQSKLVEHAVELVELATERNVKGLDKLYDDLLTLDTIAYECQTEVSISLDVLQEMDELSQLQLMMIKSSKEMYVKNMKRWVLPFLDRCEKRMPGSKKNLLSKYMLSMAKDDLEKCVLIFENSKQGVANPIVIDPKELMWLGHDCVYACKRDDQLDLAFKVMDCMPKKALGIVSEEMTSLHGLVDQLLDHLRASEILRTHDVPKPPAFIKETQDDVEESKKIMIRLTRQAARRKPPLDEYEWKQLLTDLLELQRKVYTCLMPQECYEIYVESLLGSSSLPNINLAGELVTKSATQEQYKQRLSKDPSRPEVDAAAPRIGYEKSIQLVLSAAEEYFNSSADLMDSCMDLARACLQLITDRPSSIQEELDLIASLALLDDFNVSILPLQVRLCKNRLELIEKVLKSSPNSYKQSHRLLQLAKLLRVAGDDEVKRKGSILVVIAQAAMQAKDYHTAYLMCSDIIQLNYGAGWEACQKLADETDFSNVQGRRQLLAFAAGYCQVESLEDVMRSRNHLETQILCHQIGIPVAGEKSVEETHESDEELAQPQEGQTVLKSALLMTTSTTKHVLASTGTTTKAVLSAVGDRKWWKDTLKWVRPLSQSGEEIDEQSRHHHENSGFHNHGCHPFYESVIDDPYISQGEMNYGRFQVPSSPDSPTHLSQILLRVGKLTEANGEDGHDSATEVLLELALEVLPSDLTLGLSYLLALPNPLDAEKCFQKLPRTGLVLQLSAYYYAIQLHTILLPSLEPGTSEQSYYHESPVDLIDKVINYVSDADGSDWSLEVAELVSQLQQYVKLVVDYDQAQALLKLGTGVDVQRFTHDSEYKHETILGLAMTLEEEVYELSVALATRYELPLWDVYMSHLDFLFSESGLPTQEIEARVNKLGIRSTLVSNPTKFYERLQDDVYPTIEGSDHSRLIYFYTLMQFCAREIEGDKVKPDVHVRALKKLKSAAPGLDYKSFSDGDSNPVDVIAPVLKEANVNVIAKLAAKIPMKDGSSLSTSQVYAAYLRKLFWEGDRNFKKAPETVADWLHRYEGCGEYFPKLTPVEFVAFVADVVFSTKSFERLELECRQNIINRALKYSRQQGGGGKPKFVIEKDATFMPDNAASKFLQFQQHLESLQDEDALVLKEHDQKHSTSYMQKYDLTQGDPDKLKDWLMDLLCDGAELELIEKSLLLCRLEKYSVIVTVRETLTRIVNHLKDTENGGLLTDGDDPLVLLKTVIATISKHQQQGGTLVSSHDVIDVLRSFCQDTTVNAKPRIDVLHILEETFKLDNDDAQMLLYYRTEAIVSSQWQIQVSETDTSTEEGRHKLFSLLLNQSESWDQLMALSSLLQQWPVEATSKSDNPEEEPYVQLLVAFSRHQDIQEHPQVVVDLVESLQASNPLPDQCVTLLYEELTKGNHMLCGMKIVLVTRQSSLYASITEYMQQIQEVRINQRQPYVMWHEDSISNKTVIIICQYH